MNPAPSTLPRYRLYGRGLVYRTALKELLTRSTRHREHDIEAFERALQAHFGSPIAIALPMARVAIYLAIRHYVKPGQRVFMSPYTIADIVNMVLAAGALPAFVDVEPNTGNMCPEALRHAVHQGGGAILVTHLHGIAAEIEAIAAIAREAGLPLIEDAAQSMGACTESGTYLGCHGEAGIFSLGIYKNVNSLFGGVLVTKDPQLAAAVRSEIARWPYFSRRHLWRKLWEMASIDALGSRWLFPRVLFPMFRHGILNDVESINRLTRIELDTSRRPALLAHYAGRFTPMQARMAMPQLARIHGDTQRRLAAAETYFGALEGLPNVVLPPRPRSTRHIYTYFAIRCRRRTDLLKWLMYFGRDVAAQHLKNCAALPQFAQKGQECPVASEVAESLVLLPTYPSYAGEQAGISARIVAWYLQTGEPAFDRRAAPDTPAEVLAPERPLLGAPRVPPARRPST